MCNRFALPVNPEEVAEHFELAGIPAMSPRYNIAPGEPILIVRRRDGLRIADTCRWGLRPGWIRAAGSPLLNVRAETLAAKPGRPEIARAGRCLVPAGGFFEWRHLGRARQPYFYRLKHTPLFAFAALADSVKEAGSLVRHGAIVTTEPNALVAEVHDRMPAIIPPRAYDLWLDPAVEIGEVLSLLDPWPAEAMTAHSVSTMVNRPGVEDPRLIEPSRPEALF